jgi:hypothetical protein
MSRVKIISETNETTQQESGFAEACRAALERALMDGAKTLAVVYETAGGHKALTVPDSEALADGLSRKWRGMYDVIDD